MNAVSQRTAARRLGQHRAAQAPLFRVSDPIVFITCRSGERVGEQGEGRQGEARVIRDTSIAHAFQLVNSALKRLLIVIISQAQLSEGRAGARRVSHDPFVLISGR